MMLNDYYITPPEGDDWTLERLERLDVAWETATNAPTAEEAVESLLQVIRLHEEVNYED